MGTLGLMFRQTELAWRVPHTLDSGRDGGMQGESPWLAYWSGVLVDWTGSWVYGGVRPQASTHAGSLEP